VNALPVRSDFHSVRGGDIVGEHTVMFIGEGERVEITVRSGSRANVCPRGASSRALPREQGTRPLRHAGRAGARVVRISYHPASVPAGLLRPYLVDSLEHLVGLLKRLRGIHGDHPVEQPLIIRPIRLGSFGRGALTCSAIKPDTDSASNGRLPVSIS